MNPSCQVVAPVFQQYRSILARYIQSKVHDPVDSEELLSQVMMKIYDNCEKLENIRNVEAWLVTIARNTVTDYFRQQKKEQYLEIPVLVDRDEVKDFNEDLEACVPGLIAKLPEKYREPLAAYELRGVSQKTLAVQYQMSESGMKSRIQRGRKMLRELFTKYCNHLLEAKDESCGPCNC